MGLDVSAFTRLVRDDSLDKDDYPYEYCLRPNDNKDFPGRIAPLSGDVIYRSNVKRIAFRAGSYGGYNEWRETLSKIALGVKPSEVWKNPGGYDGKPFVELINFSDCEGTIGCVVSKKLAKDFADFQPKVDSHPDQWFREKYAKWREAFDFASDNGAVDFS